MTPPAATAAGRATPRARAAARSAARAAVPPRPPARPTARSAPQARSAPRRPAGRRPPAPRRVSGPAGGAAAAAAAAPALALRGAAVARPIGLRVVRGVAALPEHRVLEHAVRARWWIGLVGFLLIGIVAMQVGLLSMNASIGRAVERAAELERTNGQLRGDVSRLGARERVTAEARRLGMVTPGTGNVRYIAPSVRRDARAAAAAVAGGAFLAGAADAAATGDGTDGAADPAATTGDETDAVADPSAGTDGSTEVSTDGSTEVSTDVSTDGEG